MDIAKNYQLYRKIATAVAETSPERAGQIDKILKEYDGDPRLLNLWLERFNSDNPWEACRNAKLVQAIFRTPKEMREERDIVRSESGHELRDELFVVTHAYDPKRTWKSGSQALTKIYQTFGTEEQQEVLTAEGRERRQQRRRGLSDEALQSVVRTLEEVLDDPNRIEDVQKHTDQAKIIAILGLDEELRRRLSQLDRVVYGNMAFVEQDSKTFLVAADRGGMFYGWFERQLEKLPIPIRDIFTTVRNPAVEIPDDERSFMLGSLIAYAASHMPIRREAVIGGYQKDLDFIMGLPKEHPLVQQYGTPQLEKVRHILAQHEVSMVDAVRVMDTYPVDVIRKEVNKAAYEKYQDEFRYIIEKLEPLLITNGKWREDCYGESIPMERLKKSVYFATLARDDFKAVRNLLRLKTLAPGERMYQAVAMEEFQGMLDEVLLAARKVQSLQKRMDADGMIVDNPEDAFNMEDGFSAMERWLARILSKLPKGSHYDIIEHFAAQYRLPFDELILRADTMLPKKSDLGKIWWKRRSPLMLERESGIYSKKRMNELSAVTEMARQCVPYEAWREKVEEALRIQSDERVQSSNFFGGWPIGKRPYLTMEEQQRILELLRVDEILKAQEATLGEKVGEILDRRKALLSLPLYRGNTQDFISMEMRHYDRGQEPKMAFGGVKILDVANLPEYMDRTLASYTTLEELQEWRNKLRYLISRNGERKLAVVGIRNSTPQAYYAVKSMEGGGYVENSFVRAIEELYTRIA